MLRPDLVVIFLHGGGFATCGLDTHDEVCRLLARASQARVIAVDYTLAPEATLQRQLDEAADVAAWVHASWGVRLALAGDSSGAYLACRTALDLAGSELEVWAQALIYPLVQLDDATWAKPYVTDARIVGRVAAVFIRRWMPGGAPSLLDHDLSLAPPTVLLSGGLDPVHADAKRLADALGRAGVAVEHVQPPLLPHGSIHLSPFWPEASRWIEEVAMRLARAADRQALVS